MAYTWWVYLHVAGALVFVAAHGVSMGVALRLRGERDPRRIMALLDISSTSISGLYVGLVLLLTGGIVAGFVGNWWGQGWIWVALGTLVALMVFMYVAASPYYKRLRTIVGAMTEGSQAVSEDRLAELVAGAATRLAKRFGAVVHIVCAHGNGVDEPTAIEVLRYAREAVRAEGAETKTHMRAGPPAQVMKELAARHDIDLIVVGNVGMGKARRFKLGGIAEEVAHEAPCDVLIIHTRDLDASPDGGYRHLLVGTDGSATASEAARKGFELAEILGADVTLVHVGDPLVGAVVLEETAKGRPGAAAVRSEAVQGDPADRIVELAGRGEVDLVVVGNKGLAGT